MEETLDILEKRINALEGRIFGKKKNIELSKPLADTVLDVNNQITSALSQRDSINAVMKRLDQLEEFLNPTYGDQSGLSAAAKLELVLAVEPELRKSLTTLEWINKSQSSINSEQLREVPELQGKLEKITLAYLEYKDQVDVQTSHIKELLMQYNDLVTTLSTCFVQWDHIVTECEVAAIPKKTLD